MVVMAAVERVSALANAALVAPPMMDRGVAFKEVDEVLDVRKDAVVDADAPDVREEMT